MEFRFHKRTFILSFFIFIIFLNDFSISVAFAYFGEHHYSYQHDVHRRPLVYNPLKNYSDSPMRLPASTTKPKSFSDITQLIPGIYFASPIGPILKPCQALLYIFSAAAVNFTQCTTENSLPPRVCTQCADSYINLERAYYTIKDNSDIKSLDGVPCNDIIFGRYYTVYVEQVFDSLTEDVWYGSRCTDCLDFTVGNDFQTTGFTNVAATTGGWSFNNKTARFLSLHSALYDCIRRTNGGDSGNISRNATVICEECYRLYDGLNLFYEESVLMNRDFCVDVDSAINDTIHYWRQQLGCVQPVLPSKSTDALRVSLISLIFFLATIGFYAFSFMQGSRRKRTLKKYRSLHPGVPDSTSVNDYDDETDREVRLRAGVNMLSGRAADRQTESTPLLFGARGRVMSYSQMSPSNLG